ncbi:MAG: adenosylcobinamide-GDP ribazoletransferase [Pseudonocardiaceae bacterium]
MIRGLALAVSWLTVVPMRASGEVDRGLARRALYWAPVLGAALGLLATVGLATLHVLDTPPLLAGLLVVGMLAMLTRGMHLDGLADTADGLGCYGGATRALAVMRDGSAGPFAVVTLVLVLATQAAALGALAETGRLLAVVLAVTAGRVAMCWCARTAMPPARADGLGALVAGSQPPAVAVAWTSALLAGGLVAIPGRAWQGVLAVGLAAMLVVAFSAHTRRRFGGVTGDVLGAASELAGTVVLVVCAVG